MDLIYADETKKDIGVLRAYDLDMAYGSDENDFQCVIDRDSHCCGSGYFLYVEGEEFGGIIDAIRVDTDKDEVTYKGRTWHGILEHKVISPDAGDDYLLLDGEANEVLQELIDRMDLGSLFTASDEDSEIEIDAYQMERYCYGYTGIRKMLKSAHAKLKVYWQNGMVVLAAEPAVDYSQDEEFDTSQVDVILEEDFRPVNHMVCLGSGELRNRAVIHIFTDENGGVQDYLVDPTADPMQDSDYILDESQKVLTGRDEVIEILDKPNNGTETNYIALTAEPANWDDVCEDYFTYEPKEEVISGETVDVGGSYKQVKKEPMKYKLTVKQPYDWAENCTAYFTYDAVNGRYQRVSAQTLFALLGSRPGNWSSAYEKYYILQSGSYRAVQGVSETSYKKQTKKPADWKKNYKKYYYRYNDGTTSEYRSVSGITYTTYDVQTKKPTDWATRYSSYYRPATAKELKNDKKKQWYNVSLTKDNKVPKWKAKTYYTAHTHEKPPKWSAATRYTRVDTKKAPTWAANTYYAKKDNQAPTWTANTYYQPTDEKITPEWISGKFFQQVFDRYAGLVDGALDKLSEYWASNELKIDLQETDQTYDVGDIVGTIENVTGLTAVQEVIKKVIKIKNDDISISYEVG